MQDHVFRHIRATTTHTHKKNTRRLMCNLYKNSFSFTEWFLAGAQVNTSLLKLLKPVSSIWDQNKIQISFLISQNNPFLQILRYTIINRNLTKMNSLLGFFVCLFLNTLCVQSHTYTKHSWLPNAVFVFNFTLVHPGYMAISGGGKKYRILMKSLFNPFNSQDLAANQSSVY